MRNWHEMPWRPKLAKGWDGDIAATELAVKEKGDPTLIGDALRKLGNQRLGPLERLRLNKLIRKAPDTASINRLQIALLSNRMTHLLATELVTQGVARGFKITCHEADYDSISATAFGNARVESTGPVDVAVILLDEDAFQEPALLLDVTAERDAILEARQWLDRIIDGIRANICSRVIIANIVPRLETRYGAYDQVILGSKIRFISAINAEILDIVETSGVILVDLCDLAATIGTMNYWDPVHHHAAKGLASPHALPLIADRISAVIAASMGKSCRVLALDLDNTLWGGVIGDDGINGISIGNGSAEGEAFLSMQRWAKRLRDRGVLLTVISKNNEPTAKEPFERHPDMILKLSDFTLFSANWSDKATNLKRQSDDLRLGLENFVFVDDNPAERERVRQMLPMVAVPEMGDDVAFYPSILSCSGYFETISLNKEDLSRAQSYAADIQRQSTLSDLGDYDAYLLSLNMKMTVRPFDDIGRARIEQLVSKSNQFNLTTRRYTWNEIATIEQASNMLHWQVRLRDKFGDHGMIAVIIIRKMPEAWSIDTWLMSCRVLERGLEQTLMNLIVEKAKENGVEIIDGMYVPTARNDRVKNFFNDMQFSKKTDNSLKFLEYRLNVNSYNQFKSAIEIDLG